MEEVHIAQLARLDSNMAHLTKSVDEFKVDMKEANKRQQDTIDSIAKNWQEMSGTIRMILDVQKQVNDHEKFIDENKYFIEELRVNTKDTKQRVKTIVFKYTVEIILVLIAAYFYIINQRESEISNLVNALKEGIVIEK